MPVVIHYRHISRLTHQPLSHFPPFGILGSRSFINFLIRFYSERMSPLPTADHDPAKEFTAEPLPSPAWDRNVPYEPFIHKPPNNQRNTQQYILNSVFRTGVLTRLTERNLGNLTRVEPQPPDLWPGFLKTVPRHFLGGSVSFRAGWAPIDQPG